MTHPIRDTTVEPTQLGIFVSPKPKKKKKKRLEKASSYTTH